MSSTAKAAAATKSPEMQRQQQHQQQLAKNAAAAAAAAMDSNHHNSSSSSSASALLNYAPVPIPNEDDRSASQQLRQLEKMLGNDDLLKDVENTTAASEHIGRISEDEIRKSLLVEAKRRKCWNSRTIDKMVFEEITQLCCYHYVLESFTETRSTAEAIESGSSTGTCSALALGRSRTNENISTANNISGIANASSDLASTTATGGGGGAGAAVKTVFHSDFGLNPWDFDIQPDDDFVNQIKILEMPNSHRLGSCHSCKGDALIHCFHCRGFGTDKCTYCRGTGMKAGVAHPALYTHPMIGTFPGDHPPVPGVGGTSAAAHAGAAAGRGYPFSGTAMIRPALLGAQRDKPYAAGTPVHFMAKAGLPPPGIGQHDLCIFCHGRGIRDCQYCKGQGKKHCLTCGGNGQIRVFTKLKVAFAVECSDFYTSCEVPEMLLRQATGELIFSETRPYVQPIRKHQIKEINEVSKRFCAAHLKKLLDSCRVLKQRHCVERIELARVHFRLGSKEGHFYVFGTQRLCFIPKSSISSNCAIM